MRSGYLELPVKYRVIGCRVATARHRIGNPRTAYGGRDARHADMVGSIAQFPSRRPNWWLQEGSL